MLSTSQCLLYSSIRCTLIQIHTAVQPAFILVLVVAGGYCSCHQPFLLNMYYLLLQIAAVVYACMCTIVMIISQMFSAYRVVRCVLR
jgi:hypothetical protein